MGLERGAVAGGEREAVAIEDIAAGDGAGEGTQAGIELGAFDAILFDDAGVVDHEFLVVEDLKIRGAAEEGGGENGEDHAGSAHRTAEEG